MAFGSDAPPIDLFLKAKSILEEAGRKDSYEYASVLNNLSLVLQEAGEFEKAYELAAAALEYMRRGIGMEHEVATSLNNLANIKLRQGNMDAAAKLASEALALYEGMAEKNSHHAAALSTVAAIYFRKCEYADAEASFRKAMELTEHFFGKNLEYAIAESNLSMTLEALGNLKSAVKHMDAAGSLLTKLLGENHPKTAEYRKSAERLQKKAEDANDERPWT